MTWNNLYLGLVGSAVAALALASTLVSAWTAGWRRSHASGSDRSAADWCLAAARARNLGLACIAAAMAVSPLVVWQWKLLHGGPSLGDPDRFLWERAALDSFTLAPLSWDRLEPWRALNPVAVGLALAGAWGRRNDPRVRFAVFAGSVLLLLSMGPLLVPGVRNPVYLAVRAVVPGFWRVAKPEVFFHGTWLLMCAVAALQLQHVVPRPRTLGALYLAFVLFWLAAVRTHPAYPAMTMPVKTELRPGWEQGVFQ